ncbi:sugar kinase [Candidatus Dojkabacteria bacterium]|nr:sugar kinase [Candidatus Dojkabacteria bacterium]
MMGKRYDVTSVGSTMLRLSVPYGKRVEYTRHFDVSIGGTESNSMIALANMGFKTAWASRLRDNPVGRRIENEIVSYRVDTSHIIWTDSERNELYFLEFGGLPRRIEATYDRNASAFAKISLEELNLDALFDTRIFHFTGIFSALSDNNLEVSQKLMKAAKKAGVKTSFDVNYRSKLWSFEEACKGLTPIMEQADLLFMTREDADNIFDLEGDPSEVVREAYKKFQPEVIVMSLGGDGGIAYDGKKEYRSQGYEVECVDRVGAGDCSNAGFMIGYLEGSIQKGLELGSAMAAIKMTIAGDLFLSSRKEVEAIMTDRDGREVGR